MKEGTERPVQDLLTIDWASLSATMSILYSPLTTLSVKGRMTDWLTMKMTIIDDPTSD